MIWFVLWVCLAIYAVAGFVILIAAGLRRAWGLLPDSPEVVARQMRMRHDRELVRLERCLGWHQPTPAYPAPGIKRFVDELSVSFRRNCVPVSNQWHIASDSSYSQFCYRAYCTTPIKLAALVFLMPGRLSLSGGPEGVDKQGHGR
jgi:hypothetical protein